MGFDKRRSGRLVALVFVAAIAIAFAPAERASAYTFKVLHAFCKSSNCPDGATPYFPPLQDSSGVLYGTTCCGGGQFNGGVVYALHPGLAYQVLYRFCPTRSCKTGELPSSPLIQDASGDLFGATQAGGAHGDGTVFELVPNADKSVWTLVTLHNFCTQSGCVDGREPFGSLTYQGAESGTPYDGTSPLYGTTQRGGVADVGVAFKLTYVPGQTLRKAKVLYNFCGQTGCPDGSYPSGLIIDGSGNLYGVGHAGGDSANHGVLFELPSGGGEIVLYRFCQQSNCTDGLSPIWPPTLDAGGKLVGTALRGYGGIVYSIAPAGANSSETVLYQFCSLASCADGDYPYGGIAIDPNGDLFGSTMWGGAYTDGDCDGEGHGCGTVFKLHGSTEHVLHSFCRAATSSCFDGKEPYYGLLSMDASGDIFGTTYGGGKYGRGVVFELTP
jgi:uncharacterized repeat protein (TIGR03803 family)